MDPCQVYRCHHMKFAEVLTPANHVDVQTNTPALTLADTMLFRAETRRQLPLTTPEQVSQGQDDLFEAPLSKQLLVQNTMLSGPGLTSRQA